MLFNHIDECRTAGSGHLLTLFIGLRPLLSLRGRRHISAQANLHHIGKPNLLEGGSPAVKGNIRPELAFCGRGQHGYYFLSRINQADYIYHEGLGTDCSKRTAVDTRTALDAFLLVYHADTVLVVSDGVHRTHLFTGSFQMSDGIVRAGCRTFTALTAFVRVDKRLIIAHRNGSEGTGALARLAHTFTAVVRNRIGGNRALLTGRIDDLDHIIRVSSRRALAFRKTDPLSDYFSLFINTAAVMGLRSGNHFARKFVPFIIHQLILPCQLRYLVKYIML